MYYSVYRRQQEGGDRFDSLLSMALGLAADLGHPMLRSFIKMFVSF
jgi:hypothetical protein